MLIQSHFLKAVVILVTELHKNMLALPGIEPEMLAYEAGALTIELSAIPSHPHNDVHTWQTISSFGWTILPHSLYCPDLASSNFHLYCSIKKRR